MWEYINFSKYSPYAIQFYFMLEETMKKYDQVLRVSKQWQFFSAPFYRVATLDQLAYIQDGFQHFGGWSIHETCFLLLHNMKVQK
jgi:hypothetical protein